jgi:hypothetical protein
MRREDVAWITQIQLVLTGGAAGLLEPVSWLALKKAQARQPERP